jgi:hypothetical protein
VRSRTQITLVAAMEAKMPEMQAALEALREKAA